MPAGIPLPPRYADWGRSPGDPNQLSNTPVMRPTPRVTDGTAPMRCRVAGPEPIAPPVSSLTPRPFCSRNNDARAATNGSQHQQQVSPRECYAPFRRPVVRPRQMHEDGTTATLHPRLPVVVQHDDHVIEPILTPQPLRARRIRVPHVAIVVSVADRVAPPVVRFQRSRRQDCPRPLDAIGAIEYEHGPPSSAGCRTIAFALDKRAAGSPEGTRQNQRSEAEYAGRRRSRARGNVQHTTISRPDIAGMTDTSTRDCHLSLDSCFYGATSDMLRPQNSPIGSVAT